MYTIHSTPLYNISCLDLFSLVLHSRVFVLSHRSSKTRRWEWLICSRSLRAGLLEHGAGRSRASVGGVNGARRCRRRPASKSNSSSSPSSQNCNVSLSSNSLSYGAGVVYVSYYRLFSYTGLHYFYLLFTVLLRFNFVTQWKQTRTSAQCSALNTVDTSSYGISGNHSPSGSKCSALAAFYAALRFMISADPLDEVSTLYVCYGSLVP